MKINFLLKLVVFSTIILLSTNPQATTITNGEFSTCNFSGWNKDTDGLGDVSAGNDFYIDGASPVCRAAIEIDSFDSPGDFFSPFLDDAWFSNTLFQELDLSGNVNSALKLTIEFAVATQGNAFNPFFVPDYFFIGLNDGLGNYYNQAGELGFIVDPSDIIAPLSNTITFELDSSFINEPGWYLDFQLSVGIDDFGMSDAFGSTLYINNVSLIDTQSHDVPEPSTLALIGVAFFGLLGRKKKT